ncbi:kynureninase [Herbiconiux sp. L3-i23]|uniref:kynureninase n=1 Tax=Herbiconiux sp. L3-i23 TaxID=2905871 RepID=UPI0020588BDA|nr:kynureninase [Herbiconiux sp. L3-i23]BDI22494.1 kynureninase [Herbiconiux sp. L3-i23]
MSDLATARELDARDQAPARDQFLFPMHGDREVAYLSGNALGLQPKSARAAVLTELDRWAGLAHAGHYEGRLPWTRYAEALRVPMGSIVGALPQETVAMNGLSVNLHLLLTTFYRPSGARTKVLMERHAFPSDVFAIRSHVAARGLDPDVEILLLEPREGEDTLRTADIIDTLERHGQQIAVVLFGGVNFLSGELLDIPAITAAARAMGCLVGWDLAHAAGNVELALHDWDVDFAAWCTYKYLNGGPGAVAGAFVHERHLGRADLPRLAGWYGQDVSDRFGDHERLMPSATADAWQISNPAILSLAPVLAAAEITAGIGMPSLAARSRRLTGYVEELVAPLMEAGRLDQLTPSDADRRGAQLSYRLDGSSQEVVDAMHALGVSADARVPDVLRLSPSPLYNSYEDCARAVAALVEVL